MINGFTNKFEANITVGKYPQGIAVLPTTNKIYVANWQSNNVTVIDGNSNKVVATFQTATPSAVAVNPNTSEVYVSNHNQATISVFNRTSNALIKTIQVGSFPVGMAVDPNRNLLYVSNFGSGTVSIIDATNNVIINVPVCGTGPYGPYGIDVDPVTGVAYASDYASNTVSVIGDASHAPHLSLSASTTTSFVGFWVTATGTLVDGTRPLRRLAPFETDWLPLPSQFRMETTIRVLTFAPIPMVDSPPTGFPQ